MDQAEFDFTGPDEDERDARRKRSIDEGFQALHAAHPEIFEEFCRLAMQLKDRGWTRYSAKGIFEVLRFRTAVESRPEEVWKLNNNYSSRYVRLLIERHPEFEGWFELRVLRTSRQPEASP